jgi:acetylcholinesterase
LIFGTYGQGNSVVSSRPSPPQEVALSEFIQGAWARFAKDPSSGPGWTAVAASPSGTDLGDIGLMGSAGVTVIRPSIVDTRCGIYYPLYKAVAGVS